MDRHRCVGRAHSRGAAAQTVRPARAPPMLADAVGPPAAGWICAIARGRERARPVRTRAARARARARARCGTGHCPKPAARTAARSPPPTRTATFTCGRCPDRGWPGRGTGPVVLTSAYAVATMLADAISYLLSAAGICAIGGREPRPVRTGALRSPGRPAPAGSCALRGRCVRAGPSGWRSSALAWPGCCSSSPSSWAWSLASACSTRCSPPTGSIRPRRTGSPAPCPPGRSPVVPPSRR